MYFKGDSIITDPCYIMRKDTNDWISVTTVREWIDWDLLTI